MTRLSSDSHYGTTVAIDGAGVLITGPSGAGKSDLALRLIDRGAKLVSDDQTLILRRGAELIATAPASIRGKLEIRGVGIVDSPFEPEIVVRMIVRLSDEYDRFPLDQQVESLTGVDIMRIKLNAKEASAPMKVEWALRNALSRPAPVVKRARLAKL